MSLPPSQPPSPPPPPPLPSSSLLHVHLEPEVDPAAEPERRLLPLSFSRRNFRLSFSTAFLRSARSGRRATDDGAPSDSPLWEDERDGQTSTLGDKRQKGRNASFSWNLEYQGGSRAIFLRCFAAGKKAQAYHVFSAPSVSFFRVW